MILCTGDIHGTNGFTRFEKLKNLSLSYNDYIIIAGDFGVIWHDLSPEYLDKNQEGLKWLRKNVNCKILFVDGNHENHNRLNSYKVTQWNGGNVHQINEQVYHLMRGENFNIDGINIFVLGGARSVDKQYRTVNKSWWANEEPSKEEIEYAICNFNNHVNDINYIITHECPNVFLPLITKYHQFFRMDNSYTFPAALDSLFVALKDSPNFNKWVFGHLHEDRVVSHNIRAIYEDIIELT